MEDDMCKKNITMIVPALFGAAVLTFTGANAKPIRTTTISTESAEAFCHGHGGGTNCVFCHRDHCHVISCSGPFCTNTVTFKHITHGAGGPASGGVKTTGGYTPPKGRVHPVRINGLKPPSGVKTTGGSFTPVTISRTQEHRSSGHK
jgi:hypothetical protein